MTHTQATVWVAMSIVVAFAYGTILWVREGQLDRVSEELDALGRTVVLLEGRVRNLADYLGVDIHDPVPDGPGEYVPDEVSAPREREQPDVFVDVPDDARPYVGAHEWEPVTEPIPVVDPMGPATVPAAVVIADGWRDLDEMYAEAKAAIAAIGEAK